MFPACGGEEVTHLLSFHSCLFSLGGCCRCRLLGDRNFEPQRFTNRRVFCFVFLWLQSSDLSATCYLYIAAAAPPGNKEIRSSQEARALRQSFSEKGGL